MGTKAVFEDIDYELVEVSKEYYDDLVDYIKATMRRIKDAQGIEGCSDYEQFPVVKI